MPASATTTTPHSQRRAVDLVGRGLGAAPGVRAAVPFAEDAPGVASPLRACFPEPGAGDTPAGPAALRVDVPPSCVAGDVPGIALPPTADVPDPPVAAGGATTL